MLPKSRRLNLKNSEAQSIFRQGKKLQSPSFKYFFRKADEFRAAVVIPKKHIRLAVKRNLLKRQVYQILQNLNLEVLKLELVVLLTSSPPSEYLLLEKEIEKAARAIIKRFEK